MKLLLEKMRHHHFEVEKYELAGKALNPLVGSHITIEFSGKKVCSACKNSTNKTFGDGFCYPCFSSLARADTCIQRPDTCHFHLGTCRQPDWGQAQCFIPHVVYLAITNRLKVGVTGAKRIHDRWGDQGAVAAVVLARTPDRRTAGLIEKVLTQHVSDRTSWQKLLKGEIEQVDLKTEKNRLASLVTADFKQHVSSNEEIEIFAYPVIKYLDKAKTINLDKQPRISEELMGIRGQYLLFKNSAINIRRHIGYEVILLH
jgi:hypothetical protein